MAHKGPAESRRGRTTHLIMTIRPGRGLNDNPTDVASRSSVRREACATAARDLHLWLLQVLAWVASRVRLPRILRLDFQNQAPKSRRDFRVLILLGMCSQMSFRKGRPKFTRRPHGIAGDQRRKTRLLPIYTRGIPLRTLRDMPDALASLDKVVKRAIARLPINGVAPALWSRLSP